MVKHNAYLLVYTGGSESDFYRMVSNAIPCQPGTDEYPIVHNDGTLEYRAEKPSDIIGYKRIGERTFQPCWPSCRWRTLTVVAQDGQLSMIPKCQYPLAKGYREEIVPSGCNSCGQREPICAKKRVLENNPQYPNS